MRAVSLTEDALLITSAFWQTNAVALRAGGEAILVDSPYLQDELDALPGLLAGAGYEPDGLIATHGDFDHLPLSLGQVQALPVPGKLDLGNGPDAIEIELHPAEGHTVDGMALFARPLGVLVVGDYVSSVEIPWIHGTLSDYRSTLKADRARLVRFVRLLRERGIFRGASKFYLSIVHDEADVAETIRAFESAIAVLAD